jgi:RNA exonuclease 4
MLSRPEKVIAVDCETVAVGDGKQSQLARVSIVDLNGVVILDTFVSPTLQVYYHMSISGVRKSDLDNGNAT